MIKNVIFRVCEPLTLGMYVVGLTDWQDGGDHAERDC
jgi:hypothetical protein